jgi:hypothetical protein
MARNQADPDANSLNKEKFLMKKIVALILILFFGMVNFGYSQSAKDTYKAVKKAELKATGATTEAESSLADARAEFDLFKDSKESKKNPEFTAHLNNAIEALRKAAFAHYLTKEGVRPDTSFSDAMSKASRELDASKRYLKQ